MPFGGVCYRPSPLSVCTVSVWPAAKEELNLICSMNKSRWVAQTLGPVCDAVVEKWQGPILRHLLTEGQALKPGCLVQIPALPLIICVTLNRRVTPIPVSLPPQLQNGDNNMTASLKGLLEDQVI